MEINVLLACNYCYTGKIFSRDSFEAKAGSDENFNIDYD